MSKVIAAVPGMERFVRDVCAVVFSFDAPPQYAAALAGSSGSGNHAKPTGANAQGAAAAAAAAASSSLEHVVPTLRMWLDDLRHLASLRAFRASVETTLLDREVLQVCSVLIFVIIIFMIIIIITIGVFVSEAVCQLPG